MLFIFSTPVSIRHLWQLKTVVFLHWCLICVPLNLEESTLTGKIFLHRMWLPLTSKYFKCLSFQCKFFLSKTVASLFFSISKCDRIKWMCGFQADLFTTQSFKIKHSQGDQMQHKGCSFQQQIIFFTLKKGYECTALAPTNYISSIPFTVCFSMLIFSCQALFN